VDSSSPKRQATDTDQRLTRFLGLPSWYESMGGDTHFPITLHHVRGLSLESSPAEGTAVINFQAGTVEITVRGLEPLPEGESYQVLLVDNKSGPANSVALDWGPDGDDIISLGVLSPEDGEASLRVPVDVERLRLFEVDMVAIVRKTPESRGQFVIGALTSFAFKLGREISLIAESESQRPGWIGPRSKAHAAGLARVSEGLLAQVQQGQTLFFNETFNGNGRTCGTCHKLNNSFTIDAPFIATLPANDPLFVFETMPAIANLENGAFLRGPRALILENIDGFDKAPVFRGSPPLFNLNLTGPFGLSSQITTLTEFCLGAVFQHLPLRLDRVAGTDFRTPTQTELNNMDAFMLSNFLPADQNFAINQFVTTAAQQSGQTLFFGAAKCSECHGGNVLAIASQALGGGNRPFNTGVVNLPINTGTAAGFGPLPAEGAGGLRTFSTPQLFGVRDTAPFFHDHSAATLREAVAFYELIQFNQSPGGAAVGGITLTGAQIDDIVAFLEALVQPPAQGTLTGTVTGTVTLQARATTTGVNVGHGIAVVTLTSGNTVLRGSVRQDGAFAIPRVPVGTFTATASAQGYLSAERANVMVTDGATTILPAVQLRLGKVNHDIGVTGVDLSAVVQSFGASPATRLSAQGFFVDNNGDGAVTGIDLSGIVNNFGLTSPTSWP
jgi:cytochrome c peroxidase